MKTIAKKTAVIIMLALLAVLISCGGDSENRLLA